MSERYLPPGVDSSSKAYEVLADQMMHTVSGGAWKMLTYVTRRTIGFGKQTDRISLSQFCNGIRKRNGKQLDRGTGLSRSAAVRALSELEEKALIERRAGLGRQAVEYAVNWAEVQRSQNDTSSETLPVTSSESLPPLVAIRYSQPTVVQPTVEQPTTARDLDCASVNRKKRDSQTRVIVSESRCKEYPRLKKALREYMNADADEPSDRLVVEVLDAANGETDEAVIDCLRHLYHTRGLKPGTENGPRLWAWFPTVVQDYFEKKQARVDAATPCGHDEWEPRNAAKFNHGAFDTTQ